jgi:hypothetical protein
MSYFSKFPLIKRNKEDVVDITRRAKLSNSIASTQYLPYTIKEGMRPEDVAHLYYDDAELAWLVLLANNIIDPYTQWPKSQTNLDAFIMKEYETKSGTTGKEVITWAQNTSLTNNIKYYKSKYVPEIQINHATYTANPTSEWRVVRVYDYEFELNEKRRIISLFNRNYVDQIGEMLEKRLNGK